MTGAFGPGLIVNCRVTGRLVPPTPVAVICATYVPWVVGVPLMRPEVVLNDRPGGRLPVRAKLVAAGLVVSCTLTALPTVAVRALPGAGKLMAGTGTTVRVCVRDGAALK